MFRIILEFFLVTVIFAAFVLAIPFLALNQLAPTLGLEYQVKIIKIK